jgi:hypothetical protein
MYFLIRLNLLSQKYSKYKNKVIVIHDIKIFEEPCIKYVACPMSAWDVIYCYTKLLRKESFVLSFRDIYS